MQERVCSALVHDMRLLEQKSWCAGTFPLQSERMYSALQGHGCKCRLVVLPYEAHGYRAYESVMHVIHEKEAWLDAHCVAPASDGVDPAAA